MPAVDSAACPALQLLPQALDNLVANPSPATLRPRYQNPEEPIQGLRWSKTGKPKPLVKGRKKMEQHRIGHSQWPKGAYYREHRSVVNDTCPDCYRV